MQKARNHHTSRQFGLSVLALGSIAVAALLVGGAASDRPAQAAASEAGPSVSAAPLLTTNPFSNGESGFVVTEIAYALGPDAEGSGSCPDGMTGGLRALMEAYKKTPGGLHGVSENPGTYGGRLEMAVSTAPDGRNLCMYPEAGGPDPNWRMVSGRNIKIGGIDLDGQHSVSGKRPTAGTCAHNDFQDSNGERGIDNQFYRVIGCTTGFQSTGQGNGFQTGMYTGSWGILVSLSGVDDVRNDPDVEVSLYANGDPIQLSAAREALPFATYAIHQDARFRSTTRGRIVDGVLTTSPVDFRFPNDVNALVFERVIRDARLKMTFTADGGMEGFLGGYTPVETLYDYQFGARDARDAKGELAPERRRISTSVGRAGALGYSCNGAYHAMYEAADGHPDANGRCTSISTQYRIRVAPAFVVNNPTQSINAPLAAR